MKGQISIDYYAAVIVFIIIVAYFVFQIANIVPRFVAQIEEESMRSESYQISEIFVNDVGHPNDWNTLVGSNPGQIQRIGFSDQSVGNSNLVSLSKVSSLQTLCANQGHEFVREIVNTDFQFSVLVVDRDTDITQATCFAPATDSSGRPFGRGFVARTSRVFAFDNGNVGELIVQVWKP
jgi:hypothetical protein